MKNTGSIALIILGFCSNLFAAKTSATSFQHCANFHYNNSADTSAYPQLTLTGTVKDKLGQPLKDVKVGAGNTIFTLTDSTGAFNFSIENKPTILTFSLAKMVTVKRSYHPSMLEKSFNVIMEKDSCKYCARISEAIHKKN